MQEIIQREISSKLKELFLSYSVYVISERALPDIRDGLKNVNRRILYAMNNLNLKSNGGTKKSARIIGDVIGMLHPHGDCLRGNTNIYGLDGKTYTIEELYNSGISELEIIAFDSKTNSIVPSKAYNFRIGQYTNLVYTISLSNGGRISVTGNHPILMHNLEWKKAEDLKIKEKLYSKKFKNYDRPIIDGIQIQDLVYDYYNGKIKKDHIRHHKDEDKNNNTRLNIESITRAQHAKIHKDYLEGLEKGRDSMFSEDGEFREQTKDKNSSLMKIFNKDQGIRRFKIAIQNLIDSDIEVTEENYESLRGSIYNLPYVDTLTERGYGNSFKEILEYSPPKVSDEYVSNKCSEVKDTKKTSKDCSFLIESSQKTRVFEVFNRIVESGEQEITLSTYEKFKKQLISEKGLGYGNISNRSYLKLNKNTLSEFLEDFYQDNIYITDITIENVIDEPMYDFTVDSFENMLIPSKNLENNIAFISVHNSSSYEAMVHMAQDFNMRYPLVTGQGNFGSIDGDPAAAMRYSEAKLSPYGEQMLKDIEKNTVKLIPNYDGSLKEPVVLPSLFPNLLGNGSNGIAVGMATSIPPHHAGSLYEALDLILKNALENKDTDINDIISIIKAPDFPTGGIIDNPSEIAKAYKEGKGKVVIKSKYHIEENKNKKYIIIDEIPFKVNKSSLVLSIDNLRKSSLPEIKEIRDESGKSGIRICIELKKEVNPTWIINKLFKSTPLQDTFSINITALYNSEPKVFNLKECLEYFLAHVMQVILNRTKHKLDKNTKRAHILEGLVKCLENINQVIELIKACEKNDLIIESLINKFDLSEEQAKYISDMKLRNLSKASSKDANQELESLNSEITYLNSIIENESVLIQVMRTELQDISEKFKDERKTSIEESSQLIEDKDLIKSQDLIITLSANGIVKSIPVEEYSSTRRGSKGTKTIDPKKDDFINQILNANSKDDLMIFTNQGKCHILEVFKIPICNKNSTGKYLSNYISLSEGEFILNVIPKKEKSKETDMILFTKKGLCKRLKLDNLSKTYKFTKVISFKDDDELVSVELINHKQEVMVFSSLGRTVRFYPNAPKVGVRPMGRGAAGVKAITLKDNDYVISSTIVDDNKKLFLVTKKGMGKRVSFEDFNRYNRGGKGVKSITIVKKTGRLLKAMTVDESEEIMIATRNGLINRFDVSEIRAMGRDASGVKLINLNEKDKVISASNNGSIKSEV